MDLMSFFANAKIWSLVAMFGTFSLIVAYAMWPGAKKGFDEAANLPLRED